MPCAATAEINLPLFSAPIPLSPPRQCRRFSFIRSSLIILLVVVFASKVQSLNGHGSHSKLQRVELPLFRDPVTGFYMFLVQ